MGALFSLIFAFLTRPADAYRPTLYYSDEPALFKTRRRDLIPTAEEVSGGQLAGRSPSTEGNPNEGKLHNVDTTDTQTNSISMQAFLVKNCPSLFRDYRPTWWLPTGHLKTGYCVVGDFTKVDKVEYDRTLLRLPDGGTLGLDFTPPRYARDLDPASPIVVVLHGLCGGSNESYLRSILVVACASKEEGGLGYRGVVVNCRGCAGVSLTTPQLYSCGHTDDLRSALVYISRRFPCAPLLGIGFSLGASVLTRYIGQEGDRCKLRSACVLGCPWDLELNSQMLESRWFYRNLYSKALGANILHLLRSHLDALAKMPPSKATPYITRLLGMRTPTLKDVDEHATRFVGGGPPMFPCSSADDYYRKASSHFYLPHIRIPFLAINTEDDPIVAENPIAEVKQSKWVALAVTKHGGHLGWFEGGWFGGLWSGPPPRWVNKPVIEWLRASAEELGKEFDARGAGTWEKDGYVLEDGREDVGYRVISENMKVLAPSRAGQWTKTESKLVFTD